MNSDVSNFILSYTKNTYLLDKMEIKCFIMAKIKVHRKLITSFYIKPEVKRTKEVHEKSRYSSCPKDKIAKNLTYVLRWNDGTNLLTILGNKCDECTKEKFTIIETLNALHVIHRSMDSTFLKCVLLNSCTSNYESNTNASCAFIHARHAFYINT